MTKGGYQLLNLVGAPGIVKGVYATLENNHDKRIVVSGLTVDGKQLDEMTVLFTKAISVYTGMFLGNEKYYLIRVQSNDNVTVTEVKLSQLPEFTAEDVDKILSIDEDGNLIWKENAGGLPEYGELQAGNVLAIEYQWDPITQTGSYVPVWKSATLPLLVMVANDELVNEFKAGDEVVATVVLNSGILLPLPTGITPTFEITQGGDIASLGEDGKTITISESAGVGDMVEVLATMSYLGMTNETIFQFIISE